MVAQRKPEPRRLVPWNPDPGDKYVCRRGGRWFACKVGDDLRITRHGPFHEAELVDFCEFLWGAVPPERVDAMDW